MLGPAILSVVIAFLIGGIPFGYLIARVVLKDDIRKHGSGNIGATNVGRVCGWKWGSLVLVLDALKGLLPTLACHWLASSNSSVHLLQLLTILTGISAIAGHMFPVWLGFKGGKGVATALGVVLVISWEASLVALLFFVITVILSRMVALASIAAALAFMVTQLILHGNKTLDPAYLPMTIFSIVIPLLIIWRHRSNIQRILRGEENRIGARKPSSEETKKH